MLEAYGVREENWRDALAKSPHFVISESPRLIGRAIVALAGDPDRSRNLELLEDLCHTMKLGSLCALGGFTPYPVMSALTHFPEDFRAPQQRLQAAE